MNIHSTFNQDDVLNQKLMHHNVYFLISLFSTEFNTAAKIEHSQK